MHKSGVLIHVHHLETAGWQELLWGDPASGAFGSLPTLLWLLLTRPEGEHIDTIILGCGPSQRDGLSEGAYTKRCMLKYARLARQFSRLKPLLDILEPSQAARLQLQLENIVVTPQIRNTREEIAAAAAIFKEQGVTTAYEISSASHAPRCMQIVATHRAAGILPPSLLWLSIPTDICFSGSVPDDTIIVEPPHRGDDPQAASQHSMSQALKPSVYMPADLQQELIGLIYGFTHDNIEHAGKGRLATTDDAVTKA